MVLHFYSMAEAGKIKSPFLAKWRRSVRMTCLDKLVVQLRSADVQKFEICLD